MTTALPDPIAIPRPGEFERRFVPQKIDLGDWDQIEPLFTSLRERTTASAEELERWLLDLSELTACLQEEGSRRHIAKTCHTDDEEIERRHLHFVTEIIPKMKPCLHAIEEKYLASEHRAALDRHRYLVHDRDVQNDITLYREENIPLQVEDSRLKSEHEKVTGAQTVEFRGQTQTMPQMNRFLEETNRTTREEAWCAMAARRLRDADTLSDMFDKMLDLRHRVAINAGFDNFRDYQHRYLARFDYTPADCVAFQQAVEAVVVPGARRLAEERTRLLAVETLRPWDLSVDPLGRPPLRPFETSDELIRGCRAVFEGVSPLLAEKFDVLSRNGLLDLDSRPAKAPGGYQSTLDEIRLPFIFMNAAGTNRDVFTLLHEGGHAFHALATRREPLLAYRQAPIEFCEVASMGMEMMALDTLENFYDAQSAQRARRMQLEMLYWIFPWVAQVDAFQHWLCTHPGHSRDDRRDAWLALDERFIPGVDWSGHETWRGLRWQAQLHLFHVPFYYIEYGIAQLGAIQLWLSHRENPGRAIENYLSGLALGGSRPLPELFQAAGLTFDLGEKTMRTLFNAVEAELARLPP